MCGIAGFCGQSSDRFEQIKKMCNKMVYRGPNAEGYWIDSDSDVVLGHRRLAIIDLSENGAQPMQSASGRYIISYNGEIYNFEEISKKLILDGSIAKFRGGSDTEVILEAFEAYGLDAIKEMKGMFAIALYDRKDKVLHLIRDRMGEKPLYYGIVGGKFAFASELSCLMSLEGFDNQIHRNALGAFVRYKSVPQPLTIYEHIYKVLPGQILSIRAPYQKAEFQTFWSCREAALKGCNHPFSGSYEEAQMELKRLLENAVRGQMIADVPIGAFLSGGIDSPLVVSAMQSLSKDSIKTFTIGFEEKNYNEAEYAKDIASHLGTSHTELYVSEKDLKEVVPLLPDIFSEPLADPACLPTYLVSKLAKSKVTVTLSGDGGDELFCGYGLYNKLAQRMQTINKVPYPLRHMAGFGLQSSPLKYNDSAYTLGEYANIQSSHQLHELFRMEHNYSAYHVVPGLDDCRNYLRSESLTLDRDILPNLDVYASQLYLDLPDVRSSMLYRDQTGFLVDTVLPKVDRAGMAISLENRIPLLDKDIVEFSWSLPISYKSQNGNDKRILKDLLYSYVPKELLDRPKHGFEVPLTRWLSSGSLHDWAGDLIASSHLVRDGYFDKKIVTNIWKEFNDKKQYTLLLWYLLQAEAWYQKQKNNE